jgi:hypothetical protein
MVKSAFSLLIYAILLAASISIAGIEWNGMGEDRNWNTAENWKDGIVPGDNDLVILKGRIASGDNSPLITRTTTASGRGFYVGYNSTVLPAQIDIESGRLTAGANGINIGFVADGKINLNGGSVKSQGDINLGQGNEWGYGTGMLEITGGIVEADKILFGTYSPDYQGGDGHILIKNGTLQAQYIDHLDTPGCFIDIEAGEIILSGDHRVNIQALAQTGYITAYSGLGEIEISYDVSYPNKTLITARDTTRYCKPLKWWDDFPRIVSTSNIQTAQYYNANICLTSGQQDPGWGLYGQKVSENRQITDDFAAAGINSIGYYETLGQTYCYISELSTPSKSDQYRTIEHQHWSWAGYTGGAINWIGLHNFFDNEYFARPWTYTNTIYGGEPMRYPEGTIASGYTLSSSDPRTSRVYDAGFAKNVLGDLQITYVYNETVNADDGSGNPVGPVTGLIYVPEDDKYAGLLQFAKDPLCPYFDSFQYSSVNYAAGNGMRGMWSDNYGPWDSLNMKPVTRAFGDWSSHRFNEYLNDTFTAVQLESMGIDDMADFEITAYLRGKVELWQGDPENFNDSKWQDARWQDDPLWQAYLIFKRKTGTAALSKYYQTTKTAAADAGQTDFAVLGNDIPGFSLGWARGSLDMVSTEMSAGWKLCAGSRGFMLPPLGRIAPAYKAAREHAKSRFVNVWFYNDHYHDYLKHSPPQYYANPSVIWVLYSEMLATQTLPKISEGNPRNTGSPAINAEFFNFVSQIAPELKNRTAVEEIAVYYSTSSIVNELLPGGIKDFENQQHQFAVWGWATALEQLHHQFRILPQWKLTAENLEELKLVIIPDSIVFEPSEIQLLQDWSEQGGRLIVTGRSGQRYDEDGNFAINPNGYSLQSLTGISDISDAPSEKTIETASGKILYIRENIGLDFFVNENERHGILQTIKLYINSALNGITPITTNINGLSSNVSVTVYQDICEGKYFIDLVNFDIDLQSDAINPTDEITFELRIPLWMNNKNMAIKTVSPKSQPEASFVKTSNDTAEITLSSFKHYACVILETRQEPDVTDDGEVNIKDVTKIAEQWQSIEGGCSAYNDWCSRSDIDKNNSVDIDDLTILAANWLEIY